MYMYIYIYIYIYIYTCLYMHTCNQVLIGLNSRDQQGNMASHL